jgi:hypothetical protein
VGEGVETAVGEGLIVGVLTILDGMSVADTGVSVAGSGALAVDEGSAKFWFMSIFAAGLLCSDGTAATVAGGSLLHLQPDSSTVTIVMTQSQKSFICVILDRQELRCWFHVNDSP